MLSHAQIWSALDSLAARYGFSASGLAKKAGLDPTTFNKSKRVSPDGRLRWPSTESIAKVLEATGASLDEVMSLVSPREGGPTRTIPLIGLAQAGAGGYFDDGGLPTGNGWEEVNFPDLPQAQVYAIEVTGESMVPLYRPGDVLICAPEGNVRRGDRVVVKTHEGEIMVKELRRKTAKTVELGSINPEHPDRILPVSDVAWMARIMWASQ
jgi:phage repressor protein C with HTH and peptisase S24 domain